MGDNSTTVNASDFLTLNQGLNTQRATYNGTERGYKNDLTNINGPNDNGLLQTSTNIFIKANNNIVGMIQSFQISENRTITKLQAIGVEGVVQAVPSNTKGGQIQTTRIALYGSRLFSAFGIKPSGPKPDDTPFRTLKDQRTPFEIQVQTKSNGAIEGDNLFYTDTYVDCWISNYSKSYTVQNITVSEQATIVYADVY